MREIIRKIASRRSLAREEARLACLSILSGEADAVEISAILMGLSVKGEDPAEISGFLEALREKMIPVSAGAGTVDIVGTGGDGLNTVNASTLASIVVASLGLPVAKHGNRGFSSASGSADLMESLGYPVEHGPEVSEKLLNSQGYAYLYAPKYHPALRIVAPIRKRLGIRTIFNLAAPLANPARPSVQVVGAPSEALARMLFESLKVSGVERFAVVTGYPGMDELSPSGPSFVMLNMGGEVRELVVDPEELGIHRIPLPKISGSSREEIVEKGVRGLKGEDEKVAAFIAMNAGLALYTAGSANSLAEGFRMALGSIESGRAWRKMVSVIQEARRLADHG